MSALRAIPSKHTAYLGMVSEYDSRFPLQLNRIFGSLRRRVGMVLTLFACLSALGISLILNWPTTYRAEATLIVAANKVNVIDIQQVMDDLRVDNFTSQTEVAVLTSRPMIEAALATLDIKAHPAYITALGLPETLKAPPLPVLVEAFAAHLQVRPGESSRAIHVRFLSPDPTFAAEAANALASAYINAQIYKKGDATKQASAWLGNRMDALRQTLLAAEQKLEAYKRESGIVSLHAGTTTAYTEQLAKLNLDLIEARNKRTEAQAKAEQITQLLGLPGGVESAASVLNDALVRSLRSQEAEVTRKIGELRSQYRDNHPNLKLAKAELQDLQGKIGQEVEKIVLSLKNDVALSRSKEAFLSNEINTLRGQFEKENEASTTLRALESEVAAHKELYALVMNRQNETSMQAVGDSHPDAQLISKASPPSLPYSPNKPLLIFICLFCAGLMSIGSVLMLEYKVPGFHNSTQIEEALGVPVLSMLPQLPSPRKDDKLHNSLFHFSHHPIYGEAIRSLRANIMASGQGSPPKIVLVTSSVPEESKTSTAFSLASLSRIHNQKCLLIDCDLRRSELAQRMNLAAPKGLGEYLSGTAELKDILCKDPKTGMYLIPAGKPILHPLDLLETRRMETLMETMKGMFELIILDAPPILSVTDALVLTKYADFTLYMVRWEKTAREAAQHGIRTLRDRSKGPLGIALSRIDIDKHRCYRYVGSDYVHFTRYGYVPQAA